MVHVKKHDITVWTGQPLTSWKLMNTFLPLPLNQTAKLNGEIRYGLVKLTVHYGLNSGSLHHATTT